jgi:hypothetical protein
MVAPFQRRRRRRRLLAIPWLIVAAVLGIVVRGQQDTDDSSNNGMILPETVTLAASSPFRMFLVSFSGGRIPDTSLVVVQDIVLTRVKAEMYAQAVRFQEQTGTTYILNKTKVALQKSSYFPSNGTTIVPFFAIAMAEIVDLPKGSAFSSQKVQDASTRRSNLDTIVYSALLNDTFLNEVKANETLRDVNFVTISGPVVMNLEAPPNESDGTKSKRELSRLDIALISLSALVFAICLLCLAVVLFRQHQEQQQDQNGTSDTIPPADSVDSDGPARALHDDTVATERVHHPPIYDQEAARSGTKINPGVANSSWTAVMAPPLFLRGPSETNSALDGSTDGRDEDSSTNISDTTEEKNLAKVASFYRVSAAGQSDLDVVTTDADSAASNSASSRDEGWETSSDDSYSEDSLVSSTSTSLGIAGSMTSADETTSAVSFISFKSDVTSATDKECIASAMSGATSPPHLLESKENTIDTAMDSLLEESFENMYFYRSESSTESTPSLPNVAKGLEQKISEESDVFDVGFEAATKPSLALQGSADQTSIAEWMTTIRVVKSCAATDSTAPGSSSQAGTSLSSMTTSSASLEQSVGSGRTLSGPTDIAEM